MTLQVELAHEKCQHHIDGGKDPELVRQMVMEIARGHVYNAADTSLRSNRQKRVGREVLGDDETPIYHIRFKGDAEGAAAAFQLWGETVTRLGGTRRIFAGQLRGSDGTHLTFLNEGSAREVEAMPQDLKDMILRELDPNQT